MSSRRQIGRSSLWDDHDAGEPTFAPLRASWDPVGEPAAPRSGARSGGGGDRSPAAEQRSRPVSRGRTTSADGAALPRTTTARSGSRPAGAGATKRVAGTPPPAARPRRRSRLGWFVHHYGWRAYALPVLLALTVIVVVQLAHAPAQAGTAGAGTSTSSATTADAGVAGPGVGGSSAAGAQAVSTTVSVDHTVTAVSTQSVTGAATVASTAGTAGASAGSVPPAGTSGAIGPDPNGAYVDVPTGVLPAGAAFAVSGKDTWHLVPGSTPPRGNGPMKFTYTVEVEDGVGNSATDQEFASAVDAALADPRSWIGSGRYTVQRISTGVPSFRVSLTSQMTERRPELCGWDIPLEASCYARDLKRVSINDARWVRGAVSFNGDLGSYRVYAINHEVGHALGYQHQPCQQDGGLAPVMMQQSWSTADDDLAPLNPQLIPPDNKVCKFNPYPFPRGPAGATVPSAAAATGSAAAGGPTG